MQHDGHEEVEEDEDDDGGSTGASSSSSLVSAPALERERERREMLVLLSALFCDLHDASFSRWFLYSPWLLAFELNGVHTTLSLRCVKDISIYSTQFYVRISVRRR
jgi:hypothetical protein